MTRSASFHITSQDLLAAYRLQFVTSFKSGQLARRYAVGIAAAGMAAAAVGWICGLTAISRVAVLGMGWAALVLPFCFLASYLCLPRRARRIFAQQKTLHGDLAMEWSESGIVFTTSRGYSRYAWSDFSRIVKGRDVIILFHSDAVMNFIPTRVLTPEQIDDFT